MIRSFHPRVAALGSAVLALAMLIGVDSASAATTSVAVTVSPAVISQVGQGFAGFSYEKDRIGAGLFDPKDTDLVHLFRLLGPSVLRVGGNLVDRVNWNPNGAGGSASEIAPADVTGFAAFVRATGWQVLYGINLKTNTPANAASEARFAAQALGQHLIAFEIGNEPNVYDTQSAYEASFDAYVSAIRAQVPDAVFDGPGQADSTTWVNTFAQHEKANGLALLSTHMYIGNETVGTIPGMLASNSSGRLPNAELAMGRAAAANGIPRWRMTETNSYFHGGKPGVSDVEAAALWSLDYMDGVASQHGEGVNFHGGTSVQFPLAYSPIVISGLTPTGVQGVYYGELLWRMAGTGPLHAATVTGGGSVTAWAIGDNVFVNNTGNTPIHATVTLPATAHAAMEFTLTAPTLASTTVTIGGSSVSRSGTFRPRPHPLPVTGRTVAVDVPAGSAALVLTH